LKPVEREIDLRCIGRLHDPSLEQAKRPFQFVEEEAGKYFARNIGSL
jgi:hypothetical protein